MPIYEYVCTACGHDFDEIQKISDKPIRKCPVCSKSKVEKKVSLSGFHLKGGGWYSDGYSIPASTGDSAKTSDNKSDNKSDKKNEPQKSNDKKKSGGEKKSSEKGTTKSQAIA